MFRTLVSLGVVLAILSQTIACIPAAVAVGAVAVHKKRTKGTLKDDAVLEKITVGETTEDEVKKLLGKPYKTVTGEDGHKLVYRFKHPKAESDSESGEPEAPGKYVVISLDKKNIVAHLERTDKEP